MHFLWEINTDLHEYIIILSFLKTKSEGLTLVLLMYKVSWEEKDPSAKYEKLTQKSAAVFFVLYLTWPQ